MPWTAAAAAAFFVAAPISAQQAGQVVATVISSDQEPLAGVAVNVQGTGIGNLTDNEGRAILLNVPAGEHTVVAQLIGYSQGEQTVTVPAGGVAQANFELATRSVEIEGIVATGTAIGAQRRELGNSISVITSDDIEAAGVKSVTDVLRGRALGVNVSGSNASPGAGAAINIRGVGSVTGRQEPLIYIDGVRMEGGALEGEATVIGGNATGLDDIDPSTIERIEVVKGAAATTLYGTEASAGVIQIFTKRGEPGEQRWTFNMEQGVALLGHVGPEEDPTGLHINDCTMDPGCPESGSWTRPGHLQDYNLSVRGGIEDITYYVSGNYGNDQGVIETPESASRLGVRGNFTFNGFETVQIRLNNSYNRRDIQWIPNGRSASGFLWNVSHRNEGSGDLPSVPWDANGDGMIMPGEEAQTDAVIFDRELDQFINSFNSNATVNWTPLNNFRHRFTGGIDFRNSHTINERPFGYWNQPDGDRSTDIENYRTLSFDYAGSWAARLPNTITSTLSWGGQYYQREHLGLRGDADEFAGPGDAVLQNAAETFAQEDKDVTQNGGFFLQEQIGWNNRLFITAGARADSHSSFGDELQTEYAFLVYPKVQAAYSISDHDFWPQWWTTQRFRAAYGESGEPPSPQASRQYYQIINANDGKNDDAAALGYLILNQGNPQIGPERTGEWEVGMDGDMVQGRVSYQFTYFDRTTRDGIIGIDPPPSNGITETIDWNVGMWKANGIETSVDVNVYESQPFRMSLSGQYQTAKTRMLNIGLETDGQWGIADVGFSRQLYEPGYPMPSIFTQIILNPHSEGEMPVTTGGSVWRGPSRPPHEYSIGTTMGFMDRLTLDVFGAGQFGHVMNADMGQRLSDDGMGHWLPCADIDEQVSALTGDQRDAGEGLEGLTAYQIMQCWSGLGDDEAWLFPGDFFRLQSASLSYRVPETWLPSSIDSGVLRFEAGNIFSIHKAPTDPDALLTPTVTASRTAGWVLPAPKTYTLNVRLNF